LFFSSLFQIFVFFFFVGLFHLLLPIDFLFLLSVSLYFLPLMYCATFPQILPPPLFSRN
jgi:hypothetical protein